MRKSTVIAIPFIDLVVVVALSVTLSANGRKHDTASSTSSSLQQQLQAMYTPAKVESDSGGPKVTNPGTVLDVQKGGILGVPWTNDVPPCPATYQNGDLQSPGMKCSMVRGKGWSEATKRIPWGNKVTSEADVDTSQTKFFAKGDKVYPLKIDVEMDKGRVVFDIVACDECNKTDPPTAYKSEIDFKFPKGYLERADVSKIEDTIGEVFALDASTNSSGDSQDQQTPPQQQAQGAGQSQDQEQSPPAQAPNPPVQ